MVKSKMTNELKNYTIFEKSNVKSAMKQIDSNDRKCLFVCKEKPKICQ